MDIDEVLARYALKDVNGADLVEVALAAIEGEFTSREAAWLAGMNDPSMIDAAPLFEKMVSQLGKKIPSRQDASILLAKIYAGRILSGQLSPKESAGKIAVLSYDLEDRPEWMRQMWALDIRMDDVLYSTTMSQKRVAQAIRELEAQVIEEARRLLDHD